MMRALGIHYKITHAALNNRLFSATKLRAPRENAGGATMSAPSREQPIRRGLDGIISGSSMPMREAEKQASLYRSKLLQNWYNPAC